MLRLSHLAALAGALLAAIAAPTAAPAATYCVGAPGGTCDGGSYDFSASGLNAAIGAASGASGADTVRVAQGTISGVGPTTVQMSTLVVGAGPGKTILESGMVNGAAFTALSAGSGFTDLTLRTTQLTSSGTVAVFNGGATAARLSVEEASTAPTNQPVTVLQLTSASATDVDVVGNSGFDRGIQLYASGALSDVSVTGRGQSGIVVMATTVPHTFDRVRVQGLFEFGIEVGGGPGLFIRDSLIDLRGGTGATGIVVTAPGVFGENDATLTRTTIVGTGGNQVGVKVRTVADGELPSVQLGDSLIDLKNGIDLTCTVDGGGAPDLNASGTAFRTQQRDAGCAGSATSAINLNATPARYVDAAAGDYRPAWNSPVIDAGVTNSPSLVLDLARLTRFVDGNGAGGAAIDLGAYEYQRRAPSAPAVTLPAAILATVPAAFSASASDADGDPLTYSWQFGDGTTDTGASLQHTFGAPGSFSVTLTVSDPTGRSAKVVSPVQVGAAPVQPTPAPVDAGQTPGGAGPGGAPQASTAPTLTLVTAPTKRIKRSRTGFAVTAASKAAAQLRLSAASTIDLSLTRLINGRRSGKACSARAVRGARCTVRRAIKGTATVNAPAGSFALAFGGTFAGRRLAAGTYEVRAVPRLAGGPAGKAISYRITLR